MSEGARREKMGRWKRARQKCRKKCYVSVLGEKEQICDEGKFSANEEKKKEDVSLLPELRK